MPVSLDNGLVVSEKFNTFLKETKYNPISRRILLRPEDSLSKDINYLDFLVDESGVKISYLNTKKFLGLFGSTIDVEEAFSDKYAKKRVFVNPGRVINKIFNENYWFPPAEIEEFVDLCKAYFGEELIFKVVKGEDIRKYYHHKNYQSQSGTLGNSCMKSGSCQEFLDIYVDNAKMLIGFSPGKDKICLRALLWDDVTVESGLDQKNIKFMDRIYTNNYFLVKQAEMWANKNGYFHRSKQTHEYTRDVLSPDGDELALEMSLPIKVKNYKRFPYMDTFAFGYKKKIKNYISKEDYIVFRETDGTYD